MKFYVLTLFPEMINTCLLTSITGRAIEKGQINLTTINIRDFTNNKHLKVDDYPYGGGAGMVMQGQPIYDAYKSIIDTIPKEESVKVIYLTPQGEVFKQETASSFVECDNIIFLCGHYEGVDERILELIVTDEISIGDYVLTGGELPAMVIIDCISRLVPGVLNNDVSSEFESFNDNLLEYPQYTRPEVFMDKKVPDVLLSGHHANIEKWKREQSVIRTLKKRPDLLEDANLTKEDKKVLAIHRKV